MLLIKKALSETEIRFQNTKKEVSKIEIFNKKLEGFHRFISSQKLSTLQTLFNAIKHKTNQQKNLF